MATVLELIQIAKSDKDIRQLINEGNNHRPSGKTRRGWLRAARQRRSELTVKLGEPQLEISNPEGWTKVSAQEEPKP